MVLSNQPSDQPSLQKEKKIFQDIESKFNQRWEFSSEELFSIQNETESMKGKRLEVG